MSNRSVNTPSYAVLFFLLLSITISSKAQWTKVSNGIQGAGLITCIAENGSNLFAGSSGGGIFLSTDNGNSWVNVNSGLTNLYINSLAINGSNILAGTEGGVFLSSNNGSNWVAINNGLPGIVNVGPILVSGNNLYAATYSYGLYLSTDSGTSWTTVNTGFDFGIYCLSISGSNIYAGTLGGGVFMSPDNGTTWTAANSGLTNLTVLAMTASGGNIYAGTNGDGVFVSSDNGTTWTATNSGLTNLFSLSMATSGSTIFLGTQSSLFRSTDSGATWSDISISSGYTTIAIAVIGTNIFAGTYGGLYLSNNNGSTWSHLVNGLTNLQIQTIASISNTVLAGTTYGAFYRSTDDGASWGSSNVGTTFNTFSAVSNVGNILFAAGGYAVPGQGVFKSTDNGATWSQNNGGLPSNFYTIALAANSNNIFLGGFGSTPMCTSTDNGVSWTATASAGLSGITNITALAVNGNNIFAGTPLGVYLSTDNGATWTAVGNGMPAHYVPSLIIVGSNIFAITDGTVYVSNNNGTSWSQTSYGLPSGSYIRTLAFSDSKIFAGGSNGGIYTSSDNGISWDIYNSNFLPNASVSSFAFSNDKVFVGTLGNGIWSRTLSTDQFTNQTATIAPTLQGVAVSSVAWGDYDNDGDLDFIQTGLNSSNNSTTQIWRNGTTGTKGSFTDQTLTIAPNLPQVFTSSVAWGDYDNDGDLDFLLSGIGTGNSISQIWRNGTTGSSGTFSDQSQILAPSLQGVYNSSVAWGDYDNDGDIDFILTGRNDSNDYISQIWRNGTLGTSGSFSDQTATIAPGLPGVGSSSVVWGDYDNDGDLDFLLAGVTNNGGDTTQIWRNGTTGSHGIFTNQTATIAPGIPGVHVSSLAWGDYDNDGDLDFMLTGYSGLVLTSQIWRNGSTGSIGIFTDQTANVCPGLTAVEQSSVAWGDYDNDGDLDFILTGFGGNSTAQIWKNGTTGTSGVFTNQTSIVAPGLSGVSASSVAWGDYDNNGTIDLLITGFLPDSNGTPTSQIWSNGTSVLNNPPKVPNNLSAIVSDNSTAKLSWSAPSDDTTPSVALSYNVRVGTSPGGGNIVSPQANTSTGYRKVIAYANAMEDSSISFYNLAPGKYYWSVQALDNDFAGGSFASEGTFCLIPPTPTITLTNASEQAPTLTSSAASENQWFLNGTMLSGATSTNYNPSVSGIYTVQTGTVGCLSEFSTGYSIVVTGVASIEQSIALFPNPTRDFVFIDGVQNMITEASVIDIMGQYKELNLEKDGDTLKGDIRSYANGVYVLNVTTASSVIKIKFIKQ